MIQSWTWNQGRFDREEFDSAGLQNIAGAKLKQRIYQLS